MTTSLFLSSPLRKIIPSGTNEVQAVPLLLQTIQAKEHDIAHILQGIDNSISILNHSLTSVKDTIGILEELGGITVRAKHIFQTPSGHEIHKKQLDELVAQFHVTLKKLDDHVQNASFGEVNLQMGQNLTTVFNPDGTQKLITIGLVCTAKNLGFRPPQFTDMMSVQNSRIDVMNAIDVAVALRNMIQDDLFTITTRQEFATSSTTAAALGRAQISSHQTLSEKENLLKLAATPLPFILAEEAQVETFQYLENSHPYKE